MNLSKKIAIDVKTKARKMKIYHLLNYEVYSVLLDNLYANIDYYRFIVEGIKDEK